MIEVDARVLNHLLVRGIGRAAMCAPPLLAQHILPMNLLLVVVMEVPKLELPRNTMSGSLRSLRSLRSLLMRLMGIRSMLLQLHPFQQHRTIWLTCAHQALTHQASSPWVTTPIYHPMKDLATCNKPRASINTPSRKLVDQLHRLPLVYSMRNRYSMPRASMVIVRLLRTNLRLLERCLEPELELVAVFNTHNLLTRLLSPRSR